MSFKIVTALLVMCISVFGEEMTVGVEEIGQTTKQDSSDGSIKAFKPKHEVAEGSETPVREGFQKGSAIMNVGILYAASLIGGDCEIGLAKVVGIQFGVGFLGADVGVNFHVFSNKHTDLYISPDLNYMPSYGAVPAANFGSRFYFGSSARVGICAYLGLGFITASGSYTVGSTKVDYKAGSMMLTYGIGMPIRMH